MTRLSVSARLALLTVGLALLTNLLVAVFVWQQVRADAIGAARRDTIEQASSLIAAWHAGGDRALDAAVAAAAASDDSLYAAVLDARGRRLRGDGPRAMAVPLVATAFATIRVDAGVRTGYALHPLGSRWLLTGRLLDDWQREEAAIVRALLIAALLSVGFGVGAGLIVTRYVGSRLDAIAATVEGVIGGDLRRRVASTARSDAFDRLARRLNAMLDRLAQLVDELRLVTDSMAHDLRSPLARLQQKVEAAVLEPDGPRRDAALAGLTAETEILMRMVATLLDIGRSEAVTRDRFTSVDPRLLATEVADLYAPVVEEAGATLALDLAAAPGATMLHRDLVTQALANLIDNALRHAPGTPITLAVRELPGVLALTVSDRGAGIAVADRELALSRFGRLDAARTTPGAGLGLALVAAVARLHGGRVELSAAHPGLAATMTLPR